MDSNKYSEKILKLDTGGGYLPGELPTATALVNTVLGPKMKINKHTKIGYTQRL